MHLKMSRFLVVFQVLYVAVQSSKTVGFGQTDDSAVFVLMLLLFVGWDTPRRNAHNPTEISHVEVQSLVTE